MIDWPILKQAFQDNLKPALKIVAWLSVVAILAYIGIQIISTFGFAAYLLFVGTVLFLVFVIIDYNYLVKRK